MEQNLSLYKIFHTVATTGSISRAAHSLYVSQPAISKSISKLEDNLGMTLFFRNSRGVTLTDEGRILYQHVNEAFDVLGKGENALMQIKTLGLGHIRIGVSTTLCKYILLPYLHDFIAAYPHIQITIVNQSSAQTISMLEQGHLDLGVIASPQAGKHIRFSVLQEIEDIFVCSPSYPQLLTIREDHEIDLFTDGTVMLLDSNNMTRQHIDAYMVEHHISTPHLLEVSTMDLIIEFAKIGLGVGGCILQAVEDELKSGTLIRIPLSAAIPKRTIGFATIADLPSSKALQSFFNFVNK